MTWSTACATTRCRFPRPRPSVAEWPVVGKKVHGILVAGPRRICRRWSRACSRSSATWPRRRWRWWPASAARCCCSWPLSSSPESSWPSAKRAPQAPRRIFDRIVGTARGEEFATLSTRDHPRGGAGCPRRGLHPGHRRRHRHDHRRRSVRGRARVGRAGARASRRCPALLVTIAGHRLDLDERRLRHRRGRHLQRAAVRRRHARQRAEAAVAGPRRRCADAGDPARRAGRPGKRAASWACSSARPCWPWAIRSSCGGWRPIRTTCRRRRCIAGCG